ncbi:MAG TPA: undecaprenyl-diphosphate phosphatase [Candidatus Pullichristensenella excrementigallinarum]|uniref:Undecaprenyl-diphosphatase n=1 Tax=Candidatus Pullichristensenella excrementigallinarum TaxID=2840907 RepID=A0A9D1IBS3_9FIRM|nr:undecaprenyl-diphosphate phosphatase [Candidatus Pullichristensenella excrementigallinarum]
MNALHALILGAVQGLTEFLPISSSGHLLVLQKIFGIGDAGENVLLFNILLHMGTLVAVFAVYWRRIWDMLCHPIQSELKYLVVATIPAVLAALLIDFDDAFEGKFIIWSFYLTSAVLIAGDAIGQWRRKNRKVHKKMRVGDAAAMGVMQAVAILPGLSRSGSTISGGVVVGLSRKHAADFSFLMSIPAILGSAVLEVKEIVFDGASAGTIGAVPTLLGMLAAALFGFLAIKGMLALIRRISMKWFALYTFLLGTFLLLDKFVFKIWMV